MGYKVAVVGATGAVGREMLKTLVERRFPITDIVALASGRSAGKQVSFGEKRVLTVQNLETFDFTGWDIALFSPGARPAASSSTTPATSAWNTTCP
jgi:aspartate-semialdehyde dehydrogenase